MIASEMFFDLVAVLVRDGRIVSVAVLGTEIVRKMAEILLFEIFAIVTENLTVEMIEELEAF